MFKSFLAVTLTGCMLVACLPQSHAEVTVGEAAPAFTVTDSNGVTHNLSDFAGKNVVLEWHNPECPYVVKHYDDSNNMQSLQEKYTGQDVVWLTINSGAQGKQGHLTPEAANALIEEKGLKSTAYIIDADGALGQMYGAKTTPHMFVINAEGTLVYAGAIDSNSSFKAEDIEGATNYVAAALDSLMAGTPIETASTQPYGCSVKY